MADALLQNISPPIGRRYHADDNPFGLRGMDHFALETLDIALMERFIREVLGGEPYYYAGFDSTDAELGRVRHIFLRVGNPNVSPHFAFAVTAEHLDRNVERLRRLRIPVQGPVRHRGVDVVSCYFQSPEGHKLEICTWDPYPFDKASYARIDWPALAHDWPRAG
jgi:catechol 2,3-dioxygenase-like lactoylglutathione lyase family enzyme